MVTPPEKHGGRTPPPPFCFPQLTPYANAPPCDGPSAQSYEDWLAARLLLAFREFRRRERLGLARFYADKCQALQASLVAGWDARRRRPEALSAQSREAPQRLPLMPERGGDFGLSADLIREPARPQQQFGLSADLAGEARPLSATAAASGEQMGGLAAEVDGAARIQPHQGASAVLASLRRQSPDEAEAAAAAEAAAEASRLRVLEDEAAEARALRDAEEEAAQQAVSTMRAIHASLLATRAAQGFRTTHVELELSRGAADPQAEYARAALDADFDAAMAEAAAERMAAAQQAARVAARGLLGKQLQARGVLGSAPPAVSDGRRPSSMALHGGGPAGALEAARDREREASAAAGRLPLLPLPPAGQQLALSAAGSSGGLSVMRRPADAEEARLLSAYEELGRPPPPAAPFDRQRSRGLALQRHHAAAQARLANPLPSPVVTAGAGRDVGDTLPLPEQQRRLRLGRTRVRIVSAILFIIFSSKQHKWKAESHACAHRCTWCWRPTAPT